MKKLLLVLMVVAMASFLLVGCLPGVVVDDDDGNGDGDGDGDGVVETAMSFAKEYTNASGVTFIPCGDTVTVTFPTAVETEYVVYTAVKDDEDEYSCMEPLIPNTDRTVWTGPLDSCIGACDDDCGYVPCEDPLNPDCGLPCCCEPICLAVLVKHPCCPGEEITFRVVTPDCTPPTLDLSVRFLDCVGPCDVADPCVLGGIQMEWTSVLSGECDPISCCDDDCSGFGDWSMTIAPDLCAGPCQTIEGSGCDVEGITNCTCLLFADPDDFDSGEVVEVCYSLEFTFADNVGNTIGPLAGTICLDTDEVVGFDFNTWYPAPINGDCTFADLPTVVFTILP